MSLLLNTVSNNVPVLVLKIWKHVAYAAYPVWARLPLTLSTPYAQPRTQLHPAESCPVSTPPELLPLTAGEPVHPCHSKGRSLGRGRPRLTWPRLLLLILTLFAQVRPALGAADYNPTLHEAQISPVAEPRPATPTFSYARERSFKRAIRRATHHPEQRTQYRGRPCTLRQLHKSE